MRARRASDRHPPSESLSAVTPESFLALTARNTHPAFLLSEEGAVVAANPSGSAVLGCKRGGQGCEVTLGDFVEDPEEAYHAHLRSWASAGLPTSRPIRLRAANGTKRRYRGEGLRVMSPGMEAHTLVLLHCVPLDPHLSAPGGAGSVPPAVASAPTPREPAGSESTPAEPSAPPPLETATTAATRTVGKMEAMGNLSAGIAHDFNNLLTVMKVEIELAIEHEDLPALVVDSLLSSHAAVVRAEALVDGLLAFSRHQLLQTSEADLRDLIERALPHVRSITEPNEPRLDAAAVPLPVLVDPEHLETVLLALVRNAVEASEAGGPIHIRTRKEVLGPDFVRDNDGATEGIFAVLKVEDRGTGITPDVAARMFEPFFTTKGRGYGRGLGLAQAFGIVKMLGGYMKVDTEVGSGSTFSVYLPLEEKTSGG
jgi:signal transduction histidine kinase